MYYIHSYTYQDTCTSAHIFMSTSSTYIRRSREINFTTSFLCLGLDPKGWLQKRHTVSCTYSLKP